MAKRQTRRSISIKGISYQRVQDYCESEGRSISGYLEDLINRDLANKNCPVPKVLRPRPKANTGPKPKTEDIVSQHFTF